MSLIVETAVVASVISALVSIGSAFVAKHKGKRKSLSEDQINQAEQELHEAYLALKTLENKDSASLKENIELLLKDVKSIKNSIVEEHDKQEELTQKTRG